MAAGRSRLARDLAPDDVLHPEVTRRGYPARVVKVGLPGEHQRHVGVLVQAPLEALRERSRHDREDQLGCRRRSLPARREVRLAGDLTHTCTWPATAGEVRVAVAERELTRAKRGLADAKRKLAEEGEEGYRAQAVTAWTDRVAACQAELDAARAQLDAERAEGTERRPGHAQQGWRATARERPVAAQRASSRSGVPQLVST